MEKEKLEKKCLNKCGKWNQLSDGEGTNVHGGTSKVHMEHTLGNFLVWHAWRKRKPLYGLMNMLNDRNHVVKANVLPFLGFYIVAFKPTQSYSDYEFNLGLKRASCHSGSCHTRGLWRGLKRRKKYKYCTDWSPELVTAACQAYSERYNKSALSAYTRTIMDHLQIYTTTHDNVLLLLNILVEKVIQ